MHGVTIHLDGEGCWPDLKPGGWEHGVLESAAYLENGTVGGAPTITLRVKLDNGQTVLAETTLRMFMTLAAGFHGRASQDGFTDIWQGPRQEPG